MSGGKSIFIGNIPYGVTEETISDTLSRAGPVVNFRLVYDKDTGRPKGFGFAEFSDSDAAASAVRNLDNYEIMGRKLRVDWSNDGSANEHNSSSAAPSHHPYANGGGGPGDAGMLGAGAAAGAAGHSGGSSLPPLPTGTDLPPGLTAPDAISRTLGTLPPPQLLDILSQMKALVMNDPNKATELLDRAPQLSYAIFQALLLLGLVDTSVLTSVVESATASAAGAPVPPQQPPPPQKFGGTGYGVPTPPQQHGAYPPPPPPPQQPAAQPNREDLIRQVLSMSQAQVDALGPAERAQIMALRQQFGGAGF